ncbi:reductase [Mangrovactinospora gilvigrisea]|uniref:Reductase n=1 Tax=Mangrovactinospora gilvigrisea TaxID=1428644 RepID=A0A1J7BEH8_9ACTN|nr:flavin reductase family protein [Mangrovactinospora gilvigrisea]OIV37083.1 reductase [Mangrovactinospora gilvigrisea]
MEARSDAAEPQAGVEEFKAALARLAGGVTLVTAFDPDDGPRGEDVGMTATAFLSISLEPPLVMVSVRTGSRMEDVLDRQPCWAVSILSDSQRHIAGRFALRGRISDRLLFEDIAYYRGEHSGAPVLGGALAWVEARTEQRIEAGDHTLFIGRVLAARTPSADGRPLAYFRGRYHQLG